MSVLQLAHVLIGDGQIRDVRLGDEIASYRAHSGDRELIVMGSLREKDRLLVHAAAGGVGIAATQIARNVGAEIFGTASPAKHDAIRAQGVAHPIDYRNQECPVPGGPVFLRRQLSSPPGDCIEGRTWGFNGYANTIWVTNGCRAEFRAGVGG